jgi:hypothetical protein
MKRLVLLALAVIALARFALPSVPTVESARQEWKLYFPIIQNQSAQRQLMGKWSIVIPEAATNLVTNPSIETDTTGYTAVGGSVARGTTYQRRGVASLTVTPTAGVNDGAYYAITLVAGTAYAFSVDVMGVDGVPYRIYVYDVTASAILGTPTTFTGDGKWHRQTVLVTTGANTSHRLYVVKNSSASTGAFYADGFQAEAAAYATTYVDGDEDGCKWNGTSHASTSTRNAQSRAGGREYDFSTLGVDVLSFTGSGMPPLANLAQERALLPGMIYRDTKIRERVLTLVFLARGSSLANLHLLRKTLINAIKPDLVYPKQPFWLRYTGAGATVEIPVVYDSGLSQGDWEGFNETMAVRFIAYDEPLWREEGERATSHTVYQSLTVNYIAGKVDGVWSNLANGTDGTLYALTIGHDGAIYAAGSFTTAGGVTVNKIAKWNGSAWSSLSTGMNDDVLALAVGADGSIYAGGVFTTAGGTTVNRVAKWDGSAWSALSTGMNGTVYALAVGLDGSIYAGGAFTTAGGTAVNYIAKWNGSAWSALGTGMDTYVSALAVGLDGSLYAGGVFTTAGGVTVNRIAKWNGSAWSALSTGMNGNVYALAIGLDGSLYAGGAFTTAGGTTVNYIAKWNGSAWTALGSGVGSDVVALAVSDSGLYVGGTFTTAGGLTISDRVAKWNGSTWSPLDIDLPGSPIVQTITTKKNNFYLGFSTSGTALVSYGNTVSTINPSTATAYPIIKITRSGGTGATLQSIKNETTGKQIVFNSPIADGDTITIDLRPGYKTVTSKTFGNWLYKVLSVSDLATFGLAPGSNLISFYVVPSGSPTVTATMRWRVMYWSADGGAE